MEKIILFLTLVTILNAKYSTKKILFLFFFFLLRFYTSAQIPTIKVSENNSNLLPVLYYDSLKDAYAIEDSIGKLIGQELYLKPKKSQFDKQYGYIGF